MNVDHCEFPEDRFYDIENDVWFQAAEDSGRRIGRAGITSIFVFLSGKITSARLRPVTDAISRGRSIATLESPKYVGAVRSPVNGTISRLNEALALNPDPLWKSPYESWIAEYESFDDNSLNDLQNGIKARDALLERINELHIRCFKLLPDEDMYSIGTECTTTLANLNELLEDKPLGYVVHLVTDDTTADIEMVRWSMQTGNELVESRKEENLDHFIVRKSLRSGHS